MAFNSFANDAGTLLVRSRAIYIAPTVSTKSLDLKVATEQRPELDFSYFVAKDIALELILATTRHTVSLGESSLGTVNLLPPTLTAQYHFKSLLGTHFDPYAGVGLNYTYFYTSNIHSSGTPVSVGHHSFGPALQIGADLPLKGDFFLNIDVKKAWIKTDVKVAATDAVLDTLSINPWIFGLGFGIKL